MVHCRSVFYSLNFQVPIGAVYTRAWFFILIAIINSKTNILIMRQFLTQKLEYLLNTIVRLCVKR